MRCHIILCFTFSFHISSRCLHCLLFIIHTSFSALPSFHFHIARFSCLSRLLLLVLMPRCQFRILRFICMRARHRLTTVTAADSSAQRFLHTMPSQHATRFAMLAACIYSFIFSSFLFSHVSSSAKSLISSQLQEGFRWLLYRLHTFRCVTPGLLSHVLHHLFIEFLFSLMWDTFSDLLSLAFCQERISPLSSFRLRQRNERH